MQLFGMSDIGLVRKDNQDSLYYHSKGEEHFAIVCDGIGGGNAGDIASKMACDLLAAAFEEKEVYSQDQHNVEWITKQVEFANGVILNKAKRHKELYGMGTTLAGVLVANQKTYVFHCGDSRVYGLYDEFICLTEDHNFAADLLKSGEVSEQEAMNHPKGSMLTNALGIWENVKVEVHKVKSNYQYLLISSDGLHGFLLDKKIHNVLLEQSTIQQKVSDFIELAKMAGGFDNISVIVMKQGGA